MTEDEMRRYCDQHREADGFCGCSSACSGPYVGGTQSDYDFMAEHLDVLVYRGGNHGSCRFEVEMRKPGTRKG